MFKLCVVQFCCHRAKMSFYAVRVGRNTGVFSSWDECKDQINGFKDARYKKFKTSEEAWNFVKSIDVPSLKRKLDYPSCSSEPLVKLRVPNVQSYYAVHRGKQRGVYKTWSECEAQIRGFNHPSYRKFSTEVEAAEFVKTGGIARCSSRQAKMLPMNFHFAKDSPDTVHDINDVKVSENDIVTVFTDGASSNNGKVGARAGIGVYWGPNHPMNTSMRLPGRQTNNRAEIFAAVHALRQAKNMKAQHVRLYTDSQFLIRGINEWIHTWKKNGWKLSTGSRVKNKNDFIELDKAREGLNVEFIYIKAHDQNPGNVEADQLAVAGARLELDDTFVPLV